MRAVLHALSESLRLDVVRINAITSDTHDLIVSGWDNKLGSVQIVFRWVIGYRVLDERDLLEFWNATGWETGAWMYRVESGGWLDLESTKEYFTSRAFNPDLTEYLIASDACCVSVLASTSPVILPLPSDGPVS